MYLRNLRKPLLLLFAGYSGAYAFNKFYTYEYKPIVLKANIKKNANFSQHYLDIKAIEIAKDSPNVLGIIGKYDTSERLGLGRIQELRNAFIDFNDSGKPTSLFFSNHMIESQLIPYYLASCFNYIVSSSPSIWNLSPNSYENFFLTRMLKNLGIQVYIEKRKEYKTFLNMLNEEKITEPHKESILQIDESVLSQVVNGISESRQIPRENVSELIHKGFFTEKEAHEHRLIDLVGTYRSLKEIIKQKLSLTNPVHPNQIKIVDLDEYSNYIRLKQIFHTFSGCKIAIVEYNDDIKKILKKIKNSKSIEVVIIRIDSRGGAFHTFQKIVNEVDDLKSRNKKVIVSFGDIAASGGYMAACKADKIVSNPGTITGSIGVVSGIPNFKGLLDKIGIDVDYIRDDLSSMSFVRPLNEIEMEGLKLSTDVIYETFKNYVAEGRNMTKDQVELIAQGKIYTGEQAKEIGLVDKLGGIKEAIELAREMINDPYATEYLISTNIVPRMKGLDFGTKLWGYIKTLIQEIDSIGTIQVKDDSIKIK